jgi:hypothetical protein
MWQYCSCTFGCCCQLAAAVTSAGQPPYRGNLITAVGRHMEFAIEVENREGSIAFVQSDAMSVSLQYTQCVQAASML